MSHRTSISVAQVPATPAARPGVPALFGCNSNRGAYLSPHKADETFRVVVVGDSMTYGQGLPHSKTLSQRIATHLNGALAGAFVEGISLGMCGACGFHALERVEDLALPLQPDVLIVALCCNDAFMLRGQPGTNEEIGQTWVAFRPHLEHALCGFAARMRGRAQRLAVLYFDRAPVYGAVSPAHVLREMCHAHGLPFIDGSDVLSGYATESLVVSVADGHLNAIANDIVARHVARFLAEQQWLPVAPPFSDPDWLAGLTTLPDRLAVSGVPPLLASARARSVLHGKWLDRRNRERQAMTAAYKRVHAEIAQRQQQDLADLVWSAMGRWLSERHHPEGPLAFAEARLHELNTIVSLLEFAQRSGSIGQRLDDLSRILGPDDGDATALADTIAAARSRALAAHVTFDAVERDLPVARGDVSADLACVRALIARVRQLATMLERAAARLSRLTAVDRAADVMRLLRYAERAVRHGIEGIASWAERLPWTQVHHAASRWSLTSPVMTIELVMAADPGEDCWSVSVDVESRYPFYHQAAVHVANLIRDGKPHAYLVELPLMVLGDIQLFFSGPTAPSGSDPGPLRLYPATLAAPGLQPQKIFTPLSIVNHTPASVTFAYRSLLLFEDQPCCQL